MIGALRVTPGNNVLSLAGADERGPDSDRLLAFVRFGVVDLGNVVLDHAAFQHVHGVQGDRGKRFEILRRGVATLFETWGKRLARHAPNVIQGCLNVQPAESPSTSFGGRFSATTVVRVMPADSACGRNDSTVSRTSAPRSVGSLCRTRLPASVSTSVFRSSTRRSRVCVASMIGARCASSAGYTP